MDFAILRFGSGEPIAKVRPAEEIGELPGLIEIRQFHRSVFSQGSNAQSFDIGLEWRGLEHEAMSRFHIENIAKDEVYNLAIEIVAFPIRQRRFRVFVNPELPVTSNKRYELVYSFPAVDLGYGGFSAADRWQEQVRWPMAKELNHAVFIETADQVAADDLSKKKTPYS